MQDFSNQAQILMPILRLKITLFHKKFHWLQQIKVAVLQVQVSESDPQKSTMNSIKIQAYDLV